MLLNLTYFSVFSVLLFCCSQPAASLIVPQELPTVLSLIYSNIPTFKKGTDSRVGVGFRLGEHADFQIMVELGPQKETRPIGDPDMENSFSKRQVSKEDQLALLRKLKRAEAAQANLQTTTTERYASSWLESWSQNMNAPTKQQSTKTKQRLASKKKQELNSPQPTMSIVPEEALRQLQLLYKLATSTTPANAVTENTNDNIAAPLDLSERLNLQQQSKLLELVNPRNAAPLEKSKAKITKELQNVRLDDDE